MKKHFSGVPNDALRPNREILGVDERSADECDPKRACISCGKNWNQAKPPTSSRKGLSATTKPTLHKLGRSMQRITGSFLEKRLLITYAVDASNFVHCVVKHSIGFMVPKFSMHDGSIDSFGYLMHYHQVMTLDVGDDALLCKVFQSVFTSSP